MPRPADNGNCTTENKTIEVLIAKQEISGCCGTPPISYARIEEKKQEKNVLRRKSPGEDLGANIPLFSCEELKRPTTSLVKQHMAESRKLH